MDHYEEGGKPFPDSIEVAREALADRVRIHQERLMANHVASRTKVTKKSIRVYIPGDFEPQQLAGTATIEESPEGSSITIQVGNSQDDDFLQRIIGHGIVGLAFFYLPQQAGTGGIINKEESSDG